MAVIARIVDEDGAIFSASNPLPVSGPVTAITAGETHIGEVSNSSTYLNLTPVLDTAIYANGDVLFTAIELTNVARVAAGVVTLDSIVVVEKDDESAFAIDLYFFDRTVTFGAVNGAPSVSDADGLFLVGRVAIVAGDFVDLGNFKMASLGNLGKVMKCAATSLWVAGVVTGTPTFTAANDMQIGFGFIDRS